MHGLITDSILSVLIFGAIIMAFIYHTVLYTFSKDKLIIHYLLYLFFTGVFVFHRTGLVRELAGVNVEDYFYNYLNEPIQIIYLAMYFNFILQSIEVYKSKNSFLYRSWIFIMTILIGYAVVFYLLKITFHFQTYVIAFVVIRAFIFVLTSVMLWQCYQLRHITFQRYILIGCTCYFIFGLISFISNINIDENAIIYPPEWLMIGSFIDIVFFSIAMSYRNKKQWESMNLALLNDANEMIEMQKIVLEKQIALENERNRIAADMHDDLGSGLTKITYLSQMAIEDYDLKENLSKINKTSSDLVENMSEIIWAMKEENNTIEDLITYIKVYCVDYLDSNAIALKMSIPEEIDMLIIKGDFRRNIFLVVKEALHNVVKHAKAKNVNITIEINNQLIIKIIDNGIGIIENQTSKNSNGLINMKKRVTSLNGKMEIKNQNGTNIKLEFPIDKLIN